jgi:3-oxoacyl-[acyl-carrier-protein] synthase II
MNERLARVVVTGMSVRSAFGDSLQGYADALFQGRSCFTPITRFDVSSMPCQLAAQCAEVPFADYLEPEEIRRYDPMANAASIYAGKALTDADIDRRPDQPKAIGTVIGASTGGWLRIHEGFERFFAKGYRSLHPFTIPRTMPNIVCALTSIRHGLRGAQVNVNAACATGTIAIGTAYRMVRLREESVVVAGGVDELSTDSHFGAWCQLRVLSEERDPARACRPFDSERAGTVLGEGAAFLVLEELEHARARGARIYGEIVGYAEGSDATHITAPCVDGQARVMEKALASAGLEPQKVDYINAHGTGTPANDRVECAAIHRVFAGRPPPVSSTKSMIGHTICAAGAMEATAVLLSMQRGMMLPTANFQNPDPDCAIDVVPKPGRRAEIRIAMSNSFAFGGANAVLIFRKPTEC